MSCVFTLPLALEPQGTILLALWTGWAMACCVSLSPQHSSFKEDLLKAQVFPEFLRQCQTSALSRHFQQLSSAAELVFQKSARVTVSTGTLHLAFDLCAHEKLLYRSSPVSSATILPQIDLLFPP